MLQNAVIVAGVQTQQYPDKARVGRDVELRLNRAMVRRNDRAGINDTACRIGQGHSHVPPPDHRVVELVRKRGTSESSYLGDEMTHLALLLPQHVPLPLLETQHRRGVNAKAGQGQPRQCQKGKPTGQPVAQRPSMSLPHGYRSSST